MTTIVFFRAEDGTTPFRDWFDALPAKAKLQCRARLQLLAQQGHLLRRPAADYLRDGIYELRAKAMGVNYRMLYFFHGRLPWSSRTESSNSRPLYRRLRSTGHAIVSEFLQPSRLVTRTP